MENQQSGWRACPLNGLHRNPDTQQYILARSSHLTRPVIWPIRNWVTFRKLLATKDFSQLSTQITGNKFGVNRTKTKIMPICAMPVNPTAV